MPKRGGALCRPTLLLPALFAGFPERCWDRGELRPMWGSSLTMSSRHFAPRRPRRSRRTNSLGDVTSAMDFSSAVWNWSGWPIGVLTSFPEDSRGERRLMRRKQKFVFLPFPPPPPFRSPLGALPAGEVWIVDAATQLRASRRRNRVSVSVSRTRSSNNSACFSASGG
jgi:hypothetical protein